ncbi:glycosyltransferase [Selenomonas sp. oral taxon 138]|uniref:glycosyltransferase n=1 Tax=Selenomonas sp. oral taxon 138 TaxID=712532 RepID=UPI00034D3B82|nr:glycosyltransferase [Selenomonas sp. oral taxon 138]
MHICIDGRVLEGSPRGMGLTLKAFLETLGEIDQENKYTILTNDRSQIHARFSSNFVFREIYIPRGIGDAFVLPYYINHINPDIAYFPENIVVPFIKKNIKVVVTIHDLMFFTEHQRLFSRQWFGAIYRQLGCYIAFRRADCIHAYTNYIANMLKEHTKKETTKFLVLTHGVPRHENIEDNKFGDLQEKQFFYTISGDTPNKAFPFLIESYKSYRKKSQNPLDLWVTGVKDRIQEDGVFYTDYISEGEKQFLLRNCRSFIFLSKDEGFGMPPLEALYLQTRSLLTDIPVLRELYGDVADFVKFGDVEGTSLELLKLEKNQKKVFSDEVWLDQFSWEHIAKQFLQEMGALAKGGLSEGAI